jgi:hypothetical protein
MTELEATVRELVQHVRALEDELAIFRILAFYGPAVDSGSSAEVAELWTEDGVYDAQLGSWSGRPAIAGMVAGPGHQGLIRGGAAHVMGGVPYIVVEGDQATATVHYLLHRREGDHFQVWRATATRWEFTRTGEGWKVTRRTNRLLDGSEEAREFLREGILEKTEPADAE